MTQQIYLRLRLYIDGSHPQTGIQLMRLLPMRGLGGPSTSLPPLKSPVVDSIYPVFLQRGFKHISTPLVHIYRASIALGYIPKIWRSSRVIFIPKPGKPNYAVAKAFTPISLASFLLKGLEKLVDRYLRGGPLSAILIHPRQHAFQTAKSTV